MVDGAVGAVAAAAAAALAAASLHALRVDARGAPRAGGGGTFLSAVVDVEDVEGVDMAGDVSVWGGRGVCECEF